MPKGSPIHVKRVPWHEQPPKPEGWAIPIHQAGGSIRAWSAVDSDTHEWASKQRWYLTSSGYAQRDARIDGKRNIILLHREVLGLKHGDGLQCDHINRDRLDNRRENLRACTAGQNCQNVPAQGGGFRGVSWYPETGCWRAYTGLDGKFHHLGFFADEKDAAIAAEAFRRSHMPYSEPEPGIDPDAPTPSRIWSTHDHHPDRTYTLGSLMGWARKWGYKEEARRLNAYRQRQHTARKNCCGQSCSRCLRKKTP